MSVTVNQHRTRLGRFILFSSFILIGLIILFRLLNGFDAEEFALLLKLIMPIKAVYLSALVKYITANPYQEEETEANTKLLSPMYVFTSTTIISVHMISLIVIITLNAFFNLLSFEWLITSISAIETFFGIYVGMFMSNLFGYKKKI